ncbi:hypothetical protein OS493_003716 [Desmophyllum pertusum]|uniref:AMOP domain-containing protein n=1 Tax=Desmophyllum pertusum TaxID=174260 RepID=A0A9X0A6J0_9CNID|nr:hypothetical protein OS493_003716 [Desmophyllum pertusum]
MGEKKSMLSVQHEGLLVLKVNSQFLCKIFFLACSAAIGDGRFVTLVLVKKTGDRHGNSPAEWIWSDLFTWRTNDERGHERCMHWYRKQPNPKIYTDDASLFPCPQTFLQAMADRGRFTMDEYCNPAAEENCERYHYEATHCFRTNIPR